MKEKDNINILEKTISKSSHTFTVKILGTGLIFLESGLCTNIFGASGFGHITLYLSLINLLKIFSSLGFNHLLTREVPITVQCERSWPKLRGLILSSKVSGISISTIILLLGLLTIKTNILDLSREETHTIIIILFYLPIITLVGIESSVIQGLGKAAESQFFNMIFSQCINIIGLLTIKFTLNSHLNYSTYFLIAIFSSLLNLVLLDYWLQSILKNKIKNYVNIIPTYNYRFLFKETTMLMLVNAVNTLSLNLDNIIMSSLLDIRLLGIYSISKKVSNVLSLFLTAMNITIAPVISKLYNDLEFSYLENFLKKNTRIIFGITMIFSLIILLLSDFILSLFGSEFLEGQKTLIILVLSQLIDVFFGPVILVLLMSKHESYVIFSYSVGLIANIIFDYIFIPRFSLVGSALATTASVLCINVLNSYFLNRKTRLRLMLFS